MLIVHHLGVSQSDRVVWLLEELSLPYEMVWHTRTEEGLAPPSLLSLHPAAMAPIIQDGELTLCESEAILPYICNRHGGGRLTVKPEGSNYADYLYWMAFNNNFMGLFFAKFASSDATQPMLKKVLDRREEGYLGFLEQTLAERPYLAGADFTCADIMSNYFLRNPSLLGGRDLPNTKAYVKRLSERPAFIKANAKAGPEASPPPTV